MSVALPRRLAGRARSRNRTSVEDLALDVRQVLAEAGVLVLDLEGELARVAQDEDRDLAVDGLELVQRREDEHGGFAHPGLGLADHVHAQDGLRDAFVLHCISETKSAFSPCSLRVAATASDTGRYDGGRRIKILAVGSVVATHLRTGARTHSRG